MKYQTKDIIYEGPTNIVYNGVLIWNGNKETEVIIKRLKNNTIDFNEENIKLPMQNFDKEINSLTALKHNGIVRLYGIDVSNENKNKMEIDLILEKGDYDLSYFIKNKNYNINDIKNFILSSIDSFKFIHESNYVHADIKPKNFIVFEKNNKFTFKIIDFDTSLNLNEYEKNNYNIQTLDYRAPEVIYKNEILTYLIDIYGFGLVIYELCKKEKLFNFNENENNENNEKNIKNYYDKNGDLKDIYLEGINNKFIKILKKCLKLDPYERLDLNEDEEYFDFN